MCLWGSGRAAQLVNANCKCEGVVLRQACVEKLAAAVLACVGLGRLRQEDFRGLLASQRRLIGKLQVQGRPDSKTGVERD